MKKFLIAVAASLIIFGGQASAAPADDLNAEIETQDVSKWAYFRDKHLLGRETDRERRERKQWERRNRPEPPPPPPPHYRDGHRHYPPPHRDGRHHYPPPPPPR